MQIEQVAGVAVLRRAINALSDGATVLLIVRGMEKEVAAAGLDLDPLEHTVHVTSGGLVPPVVLACHSIIGAYIRQP